MKQLLNRLLGQKKSTTVEALNSQALVQRPSTDRQAAAERLIAEGNALEDAGQAVDAEARYRQALQECPGLAQAVLNLGNALSAQGKLQEAATRYQEALRMKPGYGAAHANLGKLYLGAGSYQQAADHYAAAVQALPHSADALIGLGCALEELQRYPEALKAYHRALAIQPDFAGAKLNLGRTLILLGQPEEAVDYLEEARAAMPDNGLVYALLGQAMGNLCLTQQAVTYQRRALELNAPKEALLAHILLFNSNHLPDCTPEELFAAHRDYAQRYCSAFYPQNPRYENSRDPERRLKIGYVSGDFREHPVSRFLEPVLIHHDPTYFEAHLFYNYPLSDEITERLKGLAAGWHPIWNRDDDTVAHLVRSLGIDILIDLSGHTENQRLFVFARKPAVQATWLGYPGLLD
ncbi:MAG: tetratricopeptide repeat protein [Candidatus Competibacteraceae bacterium]